MMGLLIIYIPYVITFLIGYCLISILFRKSSSPQWIHLFLAVGLGSGISAHILFADLIFFGRYNQVFAAAVHLSLLTVLLIACFPKSKHFFIPPLQKNQYRLDNCGALLFLLILFIPAWIIAQFYAYGGWDAWSVWNLKSRMFFFSNDWKIIFDPALWRSNTYYPLLLPLINIWGWVFVTEPLQDVPIFVSLFFTFSTLGLLYFSLKKFITPAAALAATALLITLPIYIRLGTNQYSDIQVSYYILASVVCLVLTKTENSRSYAILSGAFIGLSSFTKNEGLLAGMIIAAFGIIYLFKDKTLTDRKKLVTAFLASAFIFAVPTMYFQAFFAPENIVMINGLTSDTHPVSLMRLKNLFGYYLVELGLPVFNLIAFLKNDGSLGEGVPFKWNGIWLFLTLGMLFSWRKLFNRTTLFVPAFLFLWGSAITVYYFIYTQWEVDWWLSVTFSRILFSILPVLVFWIFLSLWQDNKT